MLSSSREAADRALVAFLATISEPSVVGTYLTGGISLTRPPATTLDLSPPLLWRLFDPS